MKILIASFMTVAAASAALAQTPGQQVVDTRGAPVGQVVRVDASTIVVRTDRHEVSLPRSSFTAHEGKLLFAMSQAELNAATDRSLAEAAAAIAPGAAVKGSAGAPVGTIDSVEGEFVTIKLQSGKLVRIPRSGVGVADGGVVIGLTVAELEAQVPSQ